MKLLFLSFLLAQFVSAQEFLDITPPNGTTLTSPPRLGLGTWYMVGKNTSEAIASAIEQGYRHFDTEKVYMNHKSIGDGIRMGLERTGLKRSDIWVTSKLWNSEYVVACPSLSNITGADLNVEATVAQARH
jgi:diketogulonate reductase-like aldo/keto reductase